jgi:Ribbon-helix-helix protein, copG family
MRTTVTLEEDVAAKLRATARERGVSFKVAINDALRAGLNGPAPGARRFRMQTAPLGVRPGVNLDKALALAGELEDEETLRKLELRK